MSESVSDVKIGGEYNPVQCIARQTVAIIIIYRNREEHLKVMLRHIHPFLQRQQAQYRIFVVEEVSSGFLYLFYFVILLLAVMH